MPDYQAIYNNVVTSNEKYNLAENSPGFRAVIQATDNLSGLFGRSLDVGCGIGFVVEYLIGPTFNFNPFGIDVSDESVKKAKQRLAHVHNIDHRLQTSTSMDLPFEDNHFSLVTSFDVLEHLDVPDIELTLNEINRVLRPGGTFFGAVSCRKSGWNDINGENLHRSVMSPDWWIERTKPDRAIYDGHRQQLTIWKQNPLKGDDGIF